MAYSLYCHSSGWINIGEIVDSNSSKPQKRFQSHDLYFLVKSCFVFKEIEKNRYLCSYKLSVSFLCLNTVEWRSLSNRHIGMIMIRASLCICCVNALWSSEDPGCLSPQHLHPPLNKHQGILTTLCLANWLTAPMVVTVCDITQCWGPFVDT